MDYLFSRLQVIVVVEVEEIRYRYKVKGVVVLIDSIVKHRSL